MKAGKPWRGKDGRIHVIVYSGKKLQWKVRLSTPRNWGWEGK